MTSQLLCEGFIEKKKAKAGDKFSQPPAVAAGHHIDVPLFVGIDLQHAIRQVLEDILDQGRFANLARRIRLLLCRASPVHAVSRIRGMIFIAAKLTRI